MRRRRVARAGRARRRRRGAGGGGGAAGGVHRARAAGLRGDEGGVRKIQRGRWFLARQHPLVHLLGRDDDAWPRFSDFRASDGVELGEINLETISASGHLKSSGQSQSSSRASPLLLS